MSKCTSKKQIVTENTTLQTFTSLTVMKYYAMEFRNY